MEMVDIPTDILVEAHWNANQMDGDMGKRLRRSIDRFGLVENLVVRRLEDGRYEVLSGNQRLGALRGSEATSAPCVVVDPDDSDARLLGQALNHIHGEDDLWLRAELIRETLKTVPEQEVLELLPETIESLRALSALREQDIAAQLVAWQQAQSAKLRHLQIQLTDRQLEVVERALERAVPEARKRQGESPNLRGTAVYVICEAYLERLEESDE